MPLPNFQVHLPEWLPSPSTNHYKKEQLPRFLSLLMGRNWVVDLYIPREAEAAGLPLQLLIANDGQDMEACKLATALEHHYQQHKVPLLVVTIHAQLDRKMTYGVAGRPDFMQRGNLAGQYQRFVCEELLVYLNQRFNLTSKVEERAIMGFSLGGLMAIDIAWEKPILFGKTGVFSGSFWWRAKGYDQGYTDADRIMLAKIKETEAKNGLRFWLQTGTLDETADRNKDGIIDAIGDTQDLIRELLLKGYDIFRDIRYVEVLGGYHNQDTWGRILPDFLFWAFPPKKLIKPEENTSGNESGNTSTHTGSAHSITETLNQEADIKISF